MKLDLTLLLREAVRLWQGDRALLFPIAGATLFLPPFAARLLLPRPPEPGEGEATAAMMQAYAAQFAEWAGTWGVWHLVAAAIGSLGALAVFALYLDRRQPTLGNAVAHALALLPRYLLAYAAVFAGAGIAAAPVMGVVSLMLPTSIAVLVVLVPFFYLSARMMMIGPVLHAERPIGAVAAITRSWRLTRGHGWTLAWLSAMAALAGLAVASVMVALGDAAGTGSLANPVIVALTSAIAIAATAAIALMMALVAVAAYRRLSASSGT